MSDITLHPDDNDSANTWRHLLANGGYAVYADAAGNLHGVRLSSIVLGNGFIRS